MEVEKTNSQYTQSLDEPQMWTLGKASEYLLNEKGVKVPVVTLRSWFDSLEKAKVHTLPRTEGKRERILSELEIDIAVFIYEYREKFGRKISSEIIAEAVKRKFPVQYFEEGSSSNSNTEILDIETVVEELSERMKEQLLEMKEELKEEIQREMEEKERQAQLALPDPAVKEAEERIAMRTIQLNIRDTERKLRKSLQKEAEEKWNQNPIKSGFLIKKRRHC